MTTYKPQKCGHINGVLRLTGFLNKKKILLALVFVQAIEKRAIIKVVILLGWSEGGLAIYDLYIETIYNEYLR